MEARAAYASIRALTNGMRQGIVGAALRTGTFIGTGTAAYNINKDMYNEDMYLDNVISFALR